MVFGSHFWLLVASSLVAFAVLAFASGWREKPTRSDLPMVILRPLLIGITMTVILFSAIGGMLMLLMSPVDVGITPTQEGQSFAIISSSAARSVDGQGGMVLLLKNDAGQVIQETCENALTTYTISEERRAVITPAVVQDLHPVLFSLPEDAQTCQIFLPEAEIAVAFR